MRSMALQTALKDLDEAFQNFFAGRAKYPKFKTKKRAYKFSYRTRNQNGGIQIIDKHHVKLPKLGIVRARISRFPHGAIRNAVISLTAAGRYEVSFCVDEIAASKKSAGGEIAIDVGLAEFYTDSKGRIAENPHILAKLSRKLAKEQRRLSRMYEAAKKAGKSSEEIHAVFKKVMSFNPATDLDKIPKDEAHAKYRSALIHAQWAKNAGKSNEEIHEIFEKVLKSTGTSHCKCGK